MKTFLKILIWTGLGLVVIILIFYSYVSLSYQKTFDAPYPDIQASTDPAVIEKGRELALGPAHCSHCHAQATEMLKVEAGEEVSPSGGFGFALPFGTLYSPNITSDKETGIGNLTDQEIARSLRYGVGHDGRALFDFMPFYDLTDEDLTAVISWLRTLEPVKNEVPEHDYNFVGKALKTFVFQPMGDGEIPLNPTPGESAEYGKYLTQSVANCRGCHTPIDLMTGAFTGPEFSGGFKMEVVGPDGIIPNKHLVTPNLTQHDGTGIMTGWSRDQFIERMRAGNRIPGSPMPWGPFSRMSDTDLTAIYNYLVTLEPVESSIPVGIQEGDPNG